MSAGEVTDVIRKTLYVDAFAVQKVRMDRYRGKNLAEHLERALYVCPRCHGLGTLHSHGDRFACACGFSVRYNEFGFFEPGKPGDPLPFETVLAWDLWQRDFLRESVPVWRAEGGLIVQSEGQTLKKLSPEAQIWGEGVLRLYPDRLEFAGARSASFPLEEVTAFAVARQSILLFSTAAGGYYESRSAPVYGANLYNMLWRYLTGRDYV